MFIETRKQGKKKKYYLVHSYRIGGKVKRIFRYLGSNLTKKELEKLKERAKELLLVHIKEKHLFELSDDEIKELKKYEERINIEHLHKNLDWKKFTKDFAYNTNAIEGSTISYKESAGIIDKEKIPRNYDEIEMLNVAEALEFIRKTKQKLSLDLIKKMHLICFNGTKRFAGEFRDVEVVVMDGLGSIVHYGAPPGDVKNLLMELIVWYKKNNKKHPPLLLAALVHNQFEKIHPFQDGNGRVGRLLLNYVLLRQNYPPVNIKLKDRGRYYKTLQDFDKNGDIKSTIRFLISQYRKQ
ncbi:Fic family protein [Candidatus Woesearchaeota archaeon]|nr:Fic family protein [Candidatus Woesearchaeota archaeon]